MRLEDRIDHIRKDIECKRYSTVIIESARIIEFAFREIFHRALSVVDGNTRRVLHDVEHKVGGSSKTIEDFTLGQLWNLFRDSKLFDAYCKATGTQLRAIRMINFNEVINIRNKVNHSDDDASRGEALLFLQCVENMLEAFGILTLEESGTGDGDVAAPDSTPISRERRSINLPSRYVPRGETELSRLSLQGAFQKALDDRMFGYALKGHNDSLVGLDIGCANGELTRERFRNFPAVTHVIGVDKDKESIETARMASHRERWRFAVVDVESPAAQDLLVDMLAEFGDTPVIVFMAFVLNHLAAPIRVLRYLRTILPRGSKLVVRSGDDSFTHDYPDKSGTLRMILKITEEAPGKSDMRHGRKLYYQLYRAGYRKIHMFAEPILLPNLSVEERQALYAIWFHHRLQPWLDALDDGHPKASEYIAKLSVSLEEYELDMEDPSFFFLALGIGAVAEV